MGSLTELLLQIQDARERLAIAFHSKETQRAIAEVEAKPGRQLPQEIRAFYAQLTDTLYEFIDKFLNEGVLGGEEGEGLYAWRERMKALSQ